MADERENPNDGSGRNPVLLKAAKFAAIGLEFPATIAAGLFLGYYLDDYFGTSPWLVSVLGIAGFGTAFYRVLVLVRHFSQDKA